MPKDRVNTIESVKEAMSKAENFLFQIDEPQLLDLPMDTRLIYKHQLPLICCQQLEDGTLCGQTVSHTVGNILHSLKVPGHLLCQGRCDSKKKGKARRVVLEKVTVELAAARLGTWVMLPESYRKKSMPVLLKHTSCGEIIQRKLSTVIEFPVVSDSPKDTAQDCPYCTGLSNRTALGWSQDAYAKWLHLVTNGKLRYLSGSLSISDTESVPITVECQVCKEVFSDIEVHLTQTESCGCKKCAKDKSKQQRAWVLEEAKQVVARRGFVLEGNPESYTNDACILDHSGEQSGHPNILSLVKALPGGADGFGKIEILPADHSNSGRPITPAEELFIRLAHFEKRSKTWICRELGRKPGSITYKCRELELRFDAWEHVIRRFKVNDHFFSVLTAESAYWAGLIAADGCISKDITMELKVHDEEVLQQFMKALGHGGRLSYRSMKTVAGRGVYAGLRFRSRQITKDLAHHYGITPRKSLTLSPPNLQEPGHILAYICGLFEGDGHLSIVPRDGLLAQICSASRELIDWVQTQIMELVGVKACFHHRVRESHLYGLSWCGGSAASLLSALSADNGTMTRKWDRFAAYLQTKPH